MSLISFLKPSLLLQVNRCWLAIFINNSNPIILDLLHQIVNGSTLFELKRFNQLVGQVIFSNLFLLLVIFNHGLDSIVECFRCRFGRAFAASGSLL